MTQDMQHNIFNVIIHATRTPETKNSDQLMQTYHQQHGLVCH